MGIILPTILFGVLFGVPYLDRNPHRSMFKRPWAVAIGIFFVLLMVQLSYMGLPGYGIETPAATRIVQDLAPEEGAGPLRVLHSVETERRRERIAAQWQESENTSSWYWATTFSRGRLPARLLWQAGHWRWDIENGCFNSTSTHWGLDHVFKHHPVAIVNFVLTLFLAFALLQCFWKRNLKPSFRKRFTLIALGHELYASLVAAPYRHVCALPPPRGP